MEYIQWFPNNRIDFPISYSFSTLLSYSLTDSHEVHRSWEQIPHCFASFVSAKVRQWQQKVWPNSSAFLQSRRSPTIFLFLLVSLATWNAIRTWDASWSMDPSVGGDVWLQRVADVADDSLSVWSWAPWQQRYPGVILWRDPPLNPVSLLLPISSPVTVEAVPWGAIKSEKIFQRFI